MSESIKAYQGQVFQINLQSQAASTNYHWCLKTMPEEVSLMFVCDTYEEQSEIYCGGFGLKVFHFIARKPVKGGNTVTIVFEKLRPNDAHPIDPEELSVNVEIIPCNDENNSLDGFVKYSENMATYEDPSVNKALIKYGFPMHKYGYPSESCDSCEPCVVDYGFPNNNCDPCEANFKYGYPVSNDCCSDTSSINAMTAYGCPPRFFGGLKYGTPYCC